MKNISVPEGPSIVSGVAEPVAVGEKTPRVRSLRTRMVVSFTLLLLVVQSAGLVIIHRITSQNAQVAVGEQLAAGERVFSAMRDEKSRQLGQAAALLSSDFAFREAIATHDRTTVLWAMANHGARINASLVMLSDLDNRTLADTLKPDRAGQPFPFADLVKVASDKGQATAIVLIGGRAYEIVVVPVLAPLPIAWLATGFLIDDNFAKDLKQLTALDISFVDRHPENGLQLVATTLLDEKRRPLIEAVSGIQAGTSGGTTLSLGDEPYVTFVLPLSTHGDDSVVVLLQRSLSKALAPSRELQRTLLLLGAFSLLGTILASALIARGITKPLSALSAFARRIEKGDYSQTLEFHRDDEIGSLAAAINNMREGIAAREAQITDLACQDSLTRLPNRVLFSDRMQQALKIAAREDKPLSVMIMDLDRFKDVNDALGHHVGDLLLLEVATRFKAALKRDCDTVARLGGDEFAILLPGADSRGAQHVARDLLSALDRPVFLEGHQISVGSSIGIASYPAHGDDMNNLLRHADMAMYAAKRDNKGLAVYDVGFGESSRQRLSLMAELRQAVENDELVLHYQPKIDLRAATVNHVEALVRWIHPERGFITPDQFIPFAEHTGYITTITRWVAEKATRQCVAWRAKGMPIHISMNISARDLLDPELPVFFAQLLAKHHALPEWFSLEVTESAVMGDPGRSQNGLHALRDMGLQLSIDDFGTGYSSLAYLKKLPAEELKIDRSFVMAMTDDKDDAAIVRSTIELGHNMGLKVVAEGVECKATWDMLLALGCDFAQGYFMSKPLAPTDLEKWLAESGWKLALRRTAAPRKLTAVLANHGS